MSECLPDTPRYVRKTPEGFWIGADHQNGPWRPIPAPQSGLPWRTDGPAVRSREPASVAAEASSLSPAAQAIRQINDDMGDQPVLSVIAAALRAVADQVVPAVPFDRRYITEDKWNARDDVRAETLAIAAELEGLHG